MSHIAIVGPGAIGSVICALLHETARHQLLLCARRPIGELVVRAGAQDIRFSPPVLTDVGAAPPVDWVFIATKAYDAGGAAAWLPGLCARGARVAILQNGVEHRERFAGHVPETHLVPVMVDCPAERGPTAVVQRGPARLVAADDDNGRAFAELFRGATASVTTTGDLKSVLWRKLCVNAAGVVSALVLRPAGVMRDDAAADLARGIVRECIAVGRAEGAILPDDIVDTVIDGYRAAPPDSINSLHADRLAGRQTEIDARNGVIVRLGRKHGVPTPLNEMAVALMVLSGPPPAPDHTV